MKTLRAMTAGLMALMAVAAIADTYPEDCTSEIPMHLVYGKETTKNEVRTAGGTLVSSLEYKQTVWEITPSTSFQTVFQGNRDLGIYFAGEYTWTLYTCTIQYREPMPGIGEHRAYVRYYVDGVRQDNGGRLGVLYTDWEDVVYWGNLCGWDKLHHLIGEGTTVTTLESGQIQTLTRTGKEWWSLNLIGQSMSWNEWAETLGKIEGGNGQLLSVDMDALTCGQFNYIWIGDSGLPGLFTDCQIRVMREPK